MFCVFVHSVENEGRVEESQDKLTGEFTSDSGFVLEQLFRGDDVSLNKQRNTVRRFSLSLLSCCVSFWDSC